MPTDTQPKHGMLAATLYSATCVCSHIERSTIQHAALELYLPAHIKEANEEDA